MKKNIKVVGLLAAFVLAAVGQSFAASMSRDPQSNLPMDIRQLGAKAGRAEYNSAATQIITGSGILYDLCVSETVLANGAGVAAFDTSVASTINMVSINRQISPFVLQTAVAASSLPSGGVSVANCWIPVVPVRFENGLVLLMNSTAIKAVAHYRLDSGVNP